MNELTVNLQFDTERFMSAFMRELALRGVDYFEEVKSEMLRNVGNYVQIGDILEAEALYE